MYIGVSFSGSEYGCWKDSLEIHREIKGRNFYYWQYLKPIPTLCPGADRSLNIDSCMYDYKNLLIYTDAFRVEVKVSERFD